MSSTQQTILQLRTLRQNAMANAYELQLQQPKLHEMSFDDRFGMIVDHAVSLKESARVASLIKAAHFPESASLEEVDMRATRGIDKAQMASLSTCDWIRRQLNVAIIGPTGIGKSWLACAFGNQACRQTLPTTFWRTSDLVEAIATAEIDGSLKKLKASLIKPVLLILDDLGIGHISELAARTLLDVVERRMRTGSLLVTSQYTTENWHTFIHDPTVADALLDRIVHRSHKMLLKGDSMRKIQARKEMGDE